MAVVNPNNAVAEDHTAAFSDTLKVPDRFDNHLQILHKDGEVTDTYDAVNTVGMQEETARQKILRGLEERKDAEAIISNNTAKVGSGTRLMAGLGTWITNVGPVGTGVGTGGSGPTGNGTDVATPGTSRAFNSAAMLNDTMELCYNDGGQPRAMYMRPRLKKKFSALPDAFAPGTEARTMVQPNSEVTFIGAVDQYLSDFGMLQLVMSRFMHEESATSDVIYLVDPRYLSCKTLPGQAFVTQDLAKVGLTNRFQVVWQGCIQVEAPKAHGAIWALDSTA